MVVIGEVNVEQIGAAGTAGVEVEALHFPWTDLLRGLCLRIYFIHRLNVHTALLILVYTKYIKSMTSSKITNNNFSIFIKCTLEDYSIHGRKFHIFLFSWNSQTISLIHFYLFNNARATPII